MANPDTPALTPQSPSATIPHMDEPLRLLYVSGPGDIIATYAHWRAGEDDPREVNVTYSGQFFDVCRERRAHGTILSTIGPPNTFHDTTITIYHRPIPFATAGAVCYHFGQLLYALRIFLIALRPRVDFVIIARGTHWFLLTPLAWLGVRVVPTLHCVLWPKFRRPSRVQRAIGRLNGWFLRTKAAAVMSASEDIAEQVRHLTGDTPPPIVPFLPLYRRQSFEDIPLPEWRARPFRVLYAGRIEEYKGVFDLLDVARRLHDQGLHDIEFDLCGTGAAFHELKRHVEQTGLAGRFRLHGHCPRDMMRHMYGKSHVVVVPTTTRFIEGFNQVVTESILSGRPVITSSVCPALGYVRDAVLEVPPDDVAAYAAAMRQLFEDEALYESKQSACAAAQDQFYDRSQSWFAALQHVIDSRPPASSAPARGGPA
jgi:glycogen synthase